MSPRRAERDEEDGFDRPARRSRPRTKDRPDYSAAEVGIVVGVDRGVGAAQLAAEGADDVVTDLAQLLPTGHSA